MKIYTLLDLDANELNERTMTMPTDAVAKRVMKTSLEKDEMLNKNADRYNLVCLGEFDKTKGIVKSEITTVCNIADLKTVPDSETVRGE